MEKMTRIIVVLLVESVINFNVFMKHLCNQRIRFTFIF